jgi:hypothetical protein
MLRNTWKQLSSRLSNLQPSRPERHALLNYLWHDLITGFNPCFMLTYHSKAPAEQGGSLRRPPLSSATPVSSSRPCISTQKASVFNPGLPLLSHRATPQ